MGSLKNLFTSKLFAVVTTATLVIAVTLTVFVVKQQQDLRQRASTQTEPVVRGQSGDLWADVVLGQPNFTQQVPGQIVPFKVAGPGGVWVDQSAHPNRVYVFDGMNSRVLGYKSLGVCSNNSSLACTSSSDCGGNACTIQVGGETGKKVADIVIGQPGFNTSTCNENSTIWPISPASASSMCSMPSTYSPFEYGSFASPVTDSQGNLFVADPFNHRILKYNSPFTTDTIADQVWGQDSFVDNLPNKGGRADATTLSLINGSQSQKLTITVDLDAQGNLWATDPGNNRVLRYPNNNGTISKTADIVLGQPNFSSSKAGTESAQLYNPAAVRVSPIDGSVWVADAENNRILIYSQPITSGMQATRTFGDGFHNPTGIMFQKNPDNTNLAYGIWVNDTNNNQLVMFDESAQALKVLHKNAYANDWVCTYFCDSRGSTGITQDGDIISAASSNSQNVAFFQHPIPLNGSGTYFAQNYFYSPPAGIHNYVSAKGLVSPRGIAIAYDQLFVADITRILYWDIPNGASDLVNDKPADGYIGVTGFGNTLDPQFGRISADKIGNLWVTHGSNIEHYTLPVQKGQMPDLFIATNQFHFLGSTTQTGLTLGIGDIEVDPQGKFFWLTDPGRDRAFRVRIPTDKVFGTYYIDYMIGGSTFPSYNHNWGDACPDERSLCWPGSITLDKTTGDVYIADTSLEFFGDYKLFRFDASLFPQTNNSLISYLPSQASKTFTNIPIWKPEVSNNKLIAMFPYQTPNGDRVGKIGFMDNLSSQTGPTLDFTQFAGDRFSAGYSIKFDDQKNLYVTDMNWGRVLVYFNPFNLTVPTPTPRPPTPTPTNTPPPTPTPTPRGLGITLQPDKTDVTLMPGETVHAFDATSTRTTRILLGFANYTTNIPSDKFKWIPNDVNTILGNTTSFSIQADATIPVGIYQGPVKIFTISENVPLMQNDFAVTIRVISPSPIPSPTPLPSPTPIPTSTPTFLSEDIDHDGCVGILDFNAWFQAVKGTPRSGTNPDINQDGSVDIVDFNLWFIAMKNFTADKLC